MAFTKKETTFDKTKTYVFKLINGRNLHLGEECLTLDTDGVSPIKLRYLPSHPSAFQDEQGEYDDITIARLKSMPIIFSDGEKYVNSKNLFEYLTNHDDFQGKKYRLSNAPARFYLHNPDAILEAEEREQNKASLAEDSIKNAPKEQVREIAVGMFGSNPNDSDKKIMVDMRNVAKKNPNAILHAIQSDKPQRIFNVRMGFEKGILSEKGGEISWTQSGAIIMTIPKKDIVKKVDAISDYCIKEGAEFYALLRGELEKVK